MSLMVDIVSTFEINPNDIISAEYVECETVYDIEVENNHNFFLEDNILVHNSGKTEHLLIKYLLDSFRKEHFCLCYVNNEFNKIKTHQFAAFQRVAKKMKIAQYFKFNKSDYHIENLITGHKFIPFGMDEPEKTKGLDNVTNIWWDEITKSKTPTGFTTLNALLRSPIAPYLQFAISFNPVSKRHWIRHFFFDEIDAYSLKKEFKDCTLLNHSTLFDNDFIDKEAYQETLMLNSGNNQNSIIVDIKGQWGEMDLKNPFLYALSSRHLTEIEIPLNKDELVYISFDFNISPCVCVIGQYYGGQFHIVKVITSESGQNASSLQNLCQKINVYLGDLPRYQLRITGDASGKSGSADRANSKTFYTTIQEMLVVSERQIITRKANVTHNVSQEIVNYFFSRVDVTIHSCHLLTDDLYISYMDDNKTLNKAKKEYGLHVLDAFRYLIDMWASYNKNTYLSDISVIKKRINGFIK